MATKKSRKKANAEIVGFCCNYTVSVEPSVLKERGLVPENIEFKRLPCTGRLEVPAILDAFAEGAKAVFVAGCKIDECHNLSGSKRAAKRVQYARKILEELGLEPERLEMVFVPRGESEPIVEAARELKMRLSTMEGQS